jgi:hypothetical protein
MALPSLSTAMLDLHYWVNNSCLGINIRRCGVVFDVRFGSKADMCNAKAHVRSTPNSDRESGHRQTVMSALPPKADMCGAKADVR